MILMLAIMLPATMYASAPFAVIPFKDAYEPVAPKIIVAVYDTYCVIEGIIEGDAAQYATVTLFEVIGESDRYELSNPFNAARDQGHYTIRIVAVATYDNGVVLETEFDVPVKSMPSPDPHFYETGTSYWDLWVNGIYYEIKGNNAVVTFNYFLYGQYYSDYSGNVIIPKTVSHNGETYTVTAIGNDAFSGCSGLTGITLPNTITSIGKNAFYGTAWYNDQPDGLVYAGLVAYTYKGTMPAETSINLIDGTLGIAGSAFSGCNGLTSINIPNSVIAIGDNAFYCCSGLTSVTLPSSITSIGNGAFSGCRGLTSISIPVSVTSIGVDAFYHCTGLNTINVDCNNPIYDSRDNSNAIIHTSTNRIIVGCKSTVIPNSVVSISYYAFQGCTELTSISIPASVTSIADAAFTYCTGLTTINVDNSNPIFDSRDNCNAIVKTSENEIIAGCKGTVIPNSVTSIKGQEIEWAQSYDGYGWYCYHVGYGAFEGINIDSLIIPVSITNIGHGAFRGSHIKKLYFNSLYSGWEDDSPRPYDGNCCYPLEGCQADELIIGNNVNSIPYTLARNASFSTIIIPHSISIDESAFYECDNPTTIYLVGEGGRYVGYLPSTVTDLYIDAGLTSVNGMAIQPTDVYCYATIPPQCNDYTFTDYSGTLHVPAASIAAYFTAPYWCNFANIVGDIKGPNSIALNDDSVQIKIGKTFNLTATVEPADTVFDSFIFWQSSDTTIATVDFGRVTGVAEGECDITVSCLGKKAICHVTVISPISLSLDKTEVTIEKNDSTTLTATILPESESGLPITWTSSNTEVAIVDNGLVIAVEEGECDITATCLGKKAVCHVIVTKPVITITLDQDTVMVLPNHIITLTPSATPVMPENFTASSSDPTVAAARLMNGKVQVVGIKEGTATITVGSSDGTAVPATCLVTVYTEPGDVNCDGFRNISDVSSLINYLLSGDDSSIKVENADLNVDGKVAIGDVSALISGLLSGEWPSMETDDHEWVDLGLPSGTLWATCNVGASAPEEFGDYFAWGETTPRDFYDWSAYNWSAGSSTTMTKYCTSSSYGYEGFTDGKTELDLEDDAAYVNWGKKWRMPTYEQHTELHTQCTWTWTTQNGVKGYLVTGPNGNTMFMPAAGYHSERAHYSAGTEGRYWLSTLYSDRADHSYCLYFNSGSVSWDDSRRYRGFSVRAVRVSQH